MCIRDRGENIIVAVGHFVGSKFLVFLTDEIIFAFINQQIAFECRLFVVGCNARLEAAVGGLEMCIRDRTYIDNYIVYLRRENLWAILAPAVQEVYDNCKFFIAPYTPSPDFDKDTTAEELLTTFGAERNPVVSLWIYTKDDTAEKDTDMEQLTSKIQAMGYSVDVGCLLYTSIWQKKLFVFSFALTGGLIITSINNTICTLFVSPVLYDGLPYHGRELVILAVLTGLLLPLFWFVLARYYRPVEAGLTPKECTYLAGLPLFLFLLLAAGLSFIEMCIRDRYCSTLRLPRG